MKKITLFFPMLACLAALSPAHTATLEQILRAMNDYETKAAAGVRDMTILVEDKTIERGRETVRFELVLRKGDKYRIERTLPDSSRGGGVVAWPVTIADGKTTVSVDSAGNAMPEIFSDWRLRPYVSWVWSALVPPAAKLATVDNLDGRAAYQVELPPGWLNLPFTTIWLDIEKPVPVRAKSNRTLIAYTDYRSVVPGVELPHRIDTFSGGGDVITYTAVRSLEVNSGLSDDLFDPRSDPARNLRIMELLNRLRLIEDSR